MSLTNKINGIKSLMLFDNKLQLLLSRTLFHSNPVVIYCLDGKQILVDHSADDENGTRAAITSPMYKQFLSQIKLPERVNVLDLGANGGFPLMLELNGIHIRKLTCVEFNPNTYTRLRFNIERNLPAEFVGLNVAVCGEKQEFEFALGAGGTSDSLYTKHGDSGARRFKIQGLTFDDIYTSTFGDERVDICKIDVERSEYEILATPAHECLSLCNYLVMEIHPHPTVEKSIVVDELARLGFEEAARDAETDQDVYLFRNTNVPTV